MPAETRVCRDIGGKVRSRRVDTVIAEFAERQHGVVARRQLLGAGVSRNALEHRISQKRLHVVHRGIYAVGHLTLTQPGKWMGAVLAAGAGALLSHRSAAALWAVRPSTYLEVTASDWRRLAGIRVHSARIPEDELTERDGIPVTILPRTLLDLATVVPAHQVERAINEAEIQGLGNSLSLLDLLERYPGRRGVRAIRTILANLDLGIFVTRSELEALFLELVRRAGLPRPEVNVVIQVEGRHFECDCVWRAERVIVELDGRDVHSTRAAFERDRDRDRILQVAGWRIIRVTWRQLHEQPEALANDLRRLLGSAE
jgi:very-short-patch-repair endonuclease